MTEEEWLTATDPVQMLEALEGMYDTETDSGSLTRRKIRLLCVACCRRVWHRIPDEPSRAAVEQAERDLDIEIEWDERQAVYHAARRVVEETDSDFAAHAVVTMLEGFDSGTAKDVCLWTTDEIGEPCVEQAVIVRDIFSNPFRPVTLNPSWRTATVVGLAEAIYAERAFDRLPILADALEEGGCDHPDILAHCRGDGPHVRGCWVVDLLTGRE